MSDTANTETEAQTGPEATSENTDSWEAEMDRLSREAAQEQPTTEPTKSEDLGEMALLKAKLETLEQTVQADQFNKDLNNAVQTVKGDGELTVNDGLLKDIIVGKISNDPRATQIYAARFTNPAAYNTMLNSMKSEIGKQFGKSDSTTGDDVEAMEAAVRSASTQPPTETKTFNAKAVAGMTRPEYEAYKKDFLS